MHSLRVENHDLTVEQTGSKYVLLARIPSNNSACIVCPELRHVIKVPTLRIKFLDENIQFSTRNGHKAICVPVNTENCDVRATQLNRIQYFVARNVHKVNFPIGSAHQYQVIEGRFRLFSGWQHRTPSNTLNNQAALLALFMLVHALHLHILQVPFTD